MKNALVFCVNDTYAAALGATLLSLQDRSPLLYGASDKIVYYLDEISEENRKILCRICPELQFISYEEQRVFPREVMEVYKNVMFRYCFNKFFMYDLLDKYEHVIHMDTDIIVLAELIDLVNMDYDIAAVVLSPAHVSLKKMNMLPENEPDFPIVFGALISFASSMRKYDINPEKLAKYHEIVKDGTLGNIDERLMTWMTYANKMNFLILDRDIWCAPLFAVDILKTRTMHYIHHGNVKPWANPAIYASFTEWKHYYLKWLQYGGQPALQFDKPELSDPRKLYALLRSVIEAEK